VGTTGATGPADATGWECPRPVVVHSYRTTIGTATEIAIGPPSDTVATVGRRVSPTPPLSSETVCSLPHESLRELSLTDPPLGDVP